MNAVNGPIGGREIWLSEIGRAACWDSFQAQEVNLFANTFATTPWSNWTRMMLYVLYTGQSCDESIVRPDWSNRLAFDAYRDWITTH